MSRTRLSRGFFAALAIAALATGSTLVTSDSAEAGRIDPGFSRGPPRIDPGIGNGSTRVDPGFGRTESRRTYPFAKSAAFQLTTKCRWVRTYNMRWRPVGLEKDCS
jgi:hypothetical protein